MAFSIWYPPPILTSLSK
uniref:Uncharacterized protein n=1 Tax=Rhizophora mucronata TaxID=61149 RepID=A0A2P2P599_RHIMU